VRLFVAVDLDDPRREAVTRAAEAIRRLLNRSCGERAVRWIARDHLHLTIRFLGEVDEALGSRIRESLAPPLGAEPFDLALDGAGVFPPRGAPRVLWIGVTRGAAGLDRTVEAVDARLRRAGVPGAARPFSPHLTIGRFRERARVGRGDALREALAAVQVASGDMRVMSVVLYDSRLSPSGPRYEPLGRTPLAAA